MQKEILAFWFEELAMADWFKSSPVLDQEIKRRFADVHHQAIQCELFDWRSTADGRLAEIIILDQFSRNIFRDSAQAFSSDSMALVLAQEAVNLGCDSYLTAVQKSFMYMPYMHSESLKVHEQAVTLFESNGLAGNTEYEFKHKAIIERFGRYPHRNKILGRESTAEEIEFLKQPGSSF